MTWAEAPALAPGSGPGEVRLVEPAHKVDLAILASRESWLFAEIFPPGPALRGRLALLIEQAIEDALERRGAAPPGVGASSDLDASLSDQLYRARQVGAPGLALALGTLGGIANLAGALDAEDSAVLRWWLAAADERPVRIALDAADRFLGVYAAPTTLAALLERRGTSHPPTTPAPAPSPDPELTASVQAMDLSAPMPPAEFLSETVRPPSTDIAELLASTERSEPVNVTVSEPEQATEPELDHAQFTPEPETPEPHTVTEPEPVPDPELDHAHSDVVALAAPAPSPATAPVIPPSEWKTWVRELDLARGPKPLATIERLFVSAYVPLSEAAQAELVDDKARAVLRQWGKSFERSYREAFEALRHRGKRPLMVLDVPEAALRIGRLHGARSVQLLLVDGMRFDLGLRIQERLRLLVGQRAALTERLLMWAALPANTNTQLELIGRGVDGLRELGSGGADSELPVARGRSALNIRRVRAGNREIHKLDVIEARLAEHDGPIASRFDSMANEAAEALANHFLHLPARTLVMVFGDHGFVVDPTENGSNTARQGGASPEEVLVPAFAWLVGDVH